MAELRLPSRLLGLNFRGHAQNHCILAAGGPCFPDLLFSDHVVSPPYTHRGRFGVVRACRENATGRTFVAKIVPYAAEGKRRVLQEYEVLRTLHHERLMSLHEAYITPRYLVLIAESCGNRELLCGLSDR